MEAVVFISDNSCIDNSGSAFLQKEAAIILGLIFGAWKTFKPNVWVHNATELFIYGD